MKKLINSLAVLMLAVLGVTTFSSCDPCATIVCNNGACGNGTCICNAGFEKEGTACIGVNMDYISVDSSFITNVTRVDSVGNSFPTLNNVAYTVIPSSVSPYIFTLKNFNGIPSNDIIFTISTNNYDVLTYQTVVTTSLNSYTISGAKTGTQIVLTIKDLSNNVTYTLAYS